VNGLKSIPLQWFYRSLHNRGETVETLAKSIGTSRAHLTQVFNGTRRRVAKSGQPTATFNRLCWLLSEQESKLLAKVWEEKEQCSATDKVPQ